MLFDFFKPKSNSPQKKHNKASRRIKHAQNKNNRVEKISVDLLRIGMYVRELDIPWEQSSFLFQGIDMKSQQDILDVQAQCDHVWVDYEEYSLSGTKKTKTAATLKAALDPLLSVEEEYEEAFEVHTKTKAMVTSLFDSMRLGSEFDAILLKESIGSSVDSILRNPDASIWLTRLQEADNQTVQHSLNVTALSIVLGRVLGFGKEQLENLGTSAVMHDIGKTRLPLELIKKTGSLTEHEQAVYETHPQLGYDILSKANNIYYGAANVALYHHLHIDGTGYPKDLNKDEIPLFAKIICIANAYDVLTTQTLNFSALSPQDCLNKLYSESSTLYDRDLVLRFIDGMGVYPSGSIVEMKNGEVGIVLSSTRDKLKPRVIIMLDAQKDAAMQHVIDLSMMSIDSNGQPYQIKAAHPDGAFGLIVAEFQQAGLRIG